MMARFGKGCFLIEQHHILSNHYDRLNWFIAILYGFHKIRNVFD